MGTSIKAAATSRPAQSDRHNSSVALATEAALLCLDREAGRPRDIDLLINAGVYADGFVMEPAAASLIQQRIAQRSSAERNAVRSTLSFDVNCGGGGVIMAMRMAGAWLDSGRHERAMVVSGDVNITGHLTSGFGFEEGAGALLLTRVPGVEGFAAHASQCFPQLRAAFSARARNTGQVQARSGSDPTGAYVLAIQEDPSFEHAAVTCAAAMVRGFIRDHGVPAVDLLIASQYPTRFGPELGKLLELPEGSVAGPEGGTLHTAGVIAGLEASMRDGRFARARNVLFVTVAAGLSVTVAWYRKGETFTDAGDA